MNTKLQPKIDFFKNGNYKTYVISIYAIIPEIEIFICETDSHPSCDPVLHNAIFSHLIHKQKLPSNVIINKLIWP